MRAGEHEAPLPAVARAQRGEQAQREHPVLVAEVGAEAEQEAVRRQVVSARCSSPAFAPASPAGRGLAGRAVVEAGRHDLMRSSSTSASESSSRRVCSEKTTTRSAADRPWRLARR